MIFLAGKSRDLSQWWLTISLVNDCYYALAFPKLIIFCVNVLSLQALLNIIERV